MRAASVAIPAQHLAGTADPHRRDRVRSRRLLFRNHLQFYFSRRRKKLALDSVEQRRAGGYLDIGRVVWFSNGDIALVRGAAEERRRYLDFVAAQLDPGYRLHLRAYDRALRSRNYLLKAPTVRWREVEAFDEPLLAAGNAIAAARAKLLAALQPEAAATHRAISGVAGESLGLDARPGGGADFGASLAAARDEDLRLRQTTAGPHRDEVALTIGGLGTELASEGQQRTIALALRLAQAHLIAGQERTTLPLLLLDDIFGELDPARRNALLQHLPARRATNHHHHAPRLGGGASGKGLSPGGKAVESRLLIRNSHAETRRRGEEEGMIRQQRVAGSLLQVASREEIICLLRFMKMAHIRVRSWHLLGLFFVFVFSFLWFQPRTDVRTAARIGSLRWFYWCLPSSFAFPFTGFLSVPEYLPRFPPSSFGCSSAPQPLAAGTAFLSLRCFWGCTASVPWT